MPSDLTQDENERLRHAMKALRDTLYEGNSSALATALGMKQPSLSKFLNGGGGASLATAKRFAALIRKPLGQLIVEVAEADPGSPHAVYVREPLERAAEALRVLKPGPETEEAIARLSGPRFRAQMQSEDGWFEDLRHMRKTIVLERMRDPAPPLSQAEEADVDVESPAAQRSREAREAKDKLWTDIEKNAGAMLEAAEDAERLSSRKDRKKKPASR